MDTLKDNPSCSMREVDSKVSELWNTLSEEERQRYQIKAQETFALNVLAALALKRKKSTAFSTLRFKVHLSPFLKS